MGASKKHGVPVALVFSAFWIATIPWFWPLSQLPYGALMIWVVIALWGVALILMTVLRMTDHPPKIFIPPYMRRNAGDAPRGDFVLELTVAAILAVGLLTLTIFLTDGIGIQSGWVKAAIIVVWGVLVVAGARRLSRRSRVAMESARRGSDSRELPPQ
jgi:hypothetical protein